jgi:hypothetical protein
MQRDWLIRMLNNGGIFIHNHGALGTYWFSPVPRVSLDQYHFYSPWNTQYEITTTLFHEAAHHYYGADEWTAINAAAYCVQ